MDKEAQEKIIEVFDAVYYARYGLERIHTDEDYDVAKQVLQTIEELGYRKLPKGQPPLLSDEEIRRKCLGPLDGFDFDDIKKGAEAQRQADIKFYGGG